MPLESDTATPAHTHCCLSLFFGLASDLCPVGLGHGNCNARGGRARGSWGRTSECVQIRRHSPEKALSLHRPDMLEAVNAVHLAGAAEGAPTRMLLPKGKPSARPEEADGEPRKGFERCGQICIYNHPAFCVGDVSHSHQGALCRQRKSTELGWGLREGEKAWVREIRTPKSWDW